MAIGGSTTDGIHAAYIGIGGTAKKIKNIYIGVGGKAKKVKKAYIGVGGVARLWYRAKKELSYYGTATSFPVAHVLYAGTTNGNYALFGGGTDGGEVYAYNKFLVLSEPTILVNSGCTSIRAANIAGYALFAGGYNSTSSQRNNVWTYDGDLIRNTATSMSVGRSQFGAVSAEHYAVFAGGWTGSSSTDRTSNVDAYDDNLVRTRPTSLSATKRLLAGACAGDYIIFAGGTGSSYVSSADAYDADMVKVSATVSSLSTARSGLAAESLGKYAIFAGGHNSSGISTVVDVYDEDLVMATLPTGLLAGGSSYVGSASLGGYAVFAGGSTGSDYSDAVVVYDELLIRSIPTALSIGRRESIGATVDKYILFGSGYYASNQKTPVVDVYQVE